MHYTLNYNYWLNETKINLIIIWSYFKTGYIRTILVEIFKEKMKKVIKILLTFIQLINRM